MSQGKWLVISFVGMVISLTLMGLLENGWFFIFFLYSMAIGNVYSEECETMEKQNKEKIMDSEYQDRTFTLTAEQMKKFDKWRKAKNKKNGEVYVGAIGGAYTFCFTPTGLGTIETVKCADGTELDLTDMDNW